MSKSVAVGRARGRVRLAAVAVVALVGPVLLTVDNAGAAGRVEGTLDQTYAVGGVLADYGASEAAGGFGLRPGASALDASGRLLVAATRATSDGYTALRYLPNGLPDRSFGDNGMAAVTGIATLNGQLGPTAVTTDHSGRIVMAGEAWDGSHVDLAIARLTAAGVPDTSLCGTGYCIYPLGSTRTDAVGVAIQSSGKIVVGGTIDTTYFFVARYTSAGAPDSTFGDGGSKAVNLNQSSVLKAMTLLSDGRILGVGEEWDNGFHAIGMARWTSAGQLDPTFGENHDGTQITFAGGVATKDTANAVALLPDGHFLVAGYATWNNADEIVLRYNEDGSLDTGWASGGARDIDRSNTFEQYMSVAIQRDGKVVLGGNFNDSNGDHYSLVRLTPDGFLDTSFNGTGLQDFKFGGSADRLLSLHVDRQGRALAVGVANGVPGILGYVGDAVAPSVPTFNAIPLFATGSSVPVTWQSIDDNTGVQSYDVQRQQASYTSSTLGSWKTLRTTSTSRQIVVKRRPGQIDCFRVRAHDFAGNVGHYSEAHCTTFPVDDRALTVHGAWANRTGAAYYLGTARRSTRSGASLTLAAKFKQLGIVATTCSTCGRAKVYLGSRLLRTVDLHSVKTHNRVMFLVSLTPDRVQSGTVRIVQASAGKPVIIDGVGLTLDASV